MRASLRVKTRVFVTCKEENFVGIHKHKYTKHYHIGTTYISSNQGRGHILKKTIVIYCNPNFLFFLSLSPVSAMVKEYVEPKTDSDEDFVEFIEFLPSSMFLLRLKVVRTINFIWHSIHFNLLSLILSVIK